MSRIYNLDSKGTLLTTLIFLVCAGFLVWRFFIYEPAPETITQSAEVSEDELIDPGIEKPGDVEQMTLYTNFDYSGSGKSTRKYENGEFDLTISAVLPELSKGGYYEAFLSDGFGAEIKLGRLDKRGTTYKLYYESQTNYLAYDNIRISVNGADFTVEKNSRSLPFDIMEGSF